MKFRNRFKKLRSGKTMIWSNTTFSRQTKVVWLNANFLSFKKISFVFPRWLCLNGWTDKEKCVACRFRLFIVPIFYQSCINPPMPDSKSAQSWCFFRILEDKNFLGFQKRIPIVNQKSSLKLTMKKKSLRLSGKVPPIFHKKHLSSQSV